MNLPNNPTPDISQSDTYIILNTVPIINLLNGNADDIRYFIFGANATIESNSNIKLQGETDFSGTVGDALVLIFDGTQWLELSRSLNPIYTGGSLNQYFLDGGYLAQEIENLKNSMGVIQNQLSLMGVNTEDLEIIFTPGMTSYDMQYQIDSINKNIVNQSNVIIMFENGTYDITEPLLFTNFKGDGQISLMSRISSGMSVSKGVLLDGTGGNKSIIKISDCDIPIKIVDLKTQTNFINSVDYKGSIEVIRSKKINFLFMYFENSSMFGSGVYFENSEGLIHQTYVSKGLYGLWADKMSNMMIENCDDWTMPSYGISATDASNIYLLDSQQPKGNISDTFTSGASSINA